jgi:hypothetical protein
LWRSRLYERAHHKNGAIRGLPRTATPPANWLS